MELSAEDKTLISRFYNGLHHQYGSYSAHAIGWSSREVQLKRFEILSQIAPLHLSSVLDVGCGLGDLYAFLSQRVSQFHYVGIDMNQEYVRKAIEKYPRGNFQYKDIFDFSDRTFDFVFASGVFSYHVENPLEKYLKIIHKMYQVSKKGVGFNMLHREGHIVDETFMAYDPQEVIKACGSFADHIVLREGYLVEDFTIFLLKSKIEDVRSDNE